MVVVVRCGSCFYCANVFWKEHIYSLKDNKDEIKKHSVCVWAYNKLSKTHCGFVFATKTKWNHPTEKEKCGCVSVCVFDSRQLHVWCCPYTARLIQHKTGHSDINHLYMGSSPVHLLSACLLFFWFHSAMLFFPFFPRKGQHRRWYNHRSKWYSIPFSRNVFDFSFFFHAISTFIQ